MNKIIKLTVEFLNENNKITLDTILIILNYGLLCENKVVIAIEYCSMIEDIVIALNK